MTIKIENSHSTGSVTMRGDVRFSLDQPLSEIDAGSCLVIKTRKAVYCKFPEKCPDFELAEIVLKDVIVPPDGKIPYEIIMNPRPMSSVYLVEAVLNRGWCSAESNSKEWIRNEDYFNVKEQPFAVQGSEEIYKDIPVTKLVNLKVVDKGMNITCFYCMMQMHFLSAFANMTLINWGFLCCVMAVT